MKNPLSSEFTFRDIPVPWPSMLTSALGTTAPFSSRTVPLMVPTVVVCALALKNSAPISTTTTCKPSFFTIQTSTEKLFEREIVGLSELSRTRTLNQSRNCFLGLCCTTKQKHLLLLPKVVKNFSS